MPDDIERRLAAAAQAIREFEVTGRRCSDLRGREDEIRAELAELRSLYAAEERIRRGQENVAMSLRLVSDVREQLTIRSARAQARLTAIEAQRRDLLSR